MKPKPNSKESDGQFLMTTYKDGPIFEEVITKEQMMKLSPADTDFFHNEVTGWSFIKPETGDRIEYFGGIPEVGLTAWELIELFMRSPGEFFSLDRIYELTGNESFACGSNVSGFLKRIRRAFGESGDEPYFFLTHRESPYRICWHKDRSWRIIERLAQPSNHDANA